MFLSSVKKMFSHVESYRAVITGFLLVFVINIIFEIKENLTLILLAVLTMFLSFLIAKKTSHHFHGEHKHSGDSTIDAMPVAVLFLANILHPAVDGFSTYESFERVGFSAGILILLSVIIHEVFRQWALVTFFKQLGINKWWVIFTAVLGVLSGALFGFLGSSLLEKGESLIDLAVIFAYSFIIFEFHFSELKENKSTKIAFVLIGIFIGILMSLITFGH